MTIDQFDQHLITTRAQFIAVFNQNSEVTELDIHTKLILDYQDLIAKSLFSELNNLKKDLITIKGDILKDNRERFELIINKLNNDSK
ncbi:hypothetical protein [Flavobacterium sp. PS2]|uniref:hypothetical protein n=1 Tax=Flavobacterium sp. PS2 TaxID=3384157 RepID=UPI00390C7F27